ncbi:hypothetical protein, partial [Dysosmobacter sp.]|uniref:hypothetical protein n=1 Tax=Dysosmobacter sp. TaxID=2591382 RepID=UPI003AF1BA7F
YSSFPHNKKAEKKRKKRTANAVRPLARYGVNLCPYEHYPSDSGDFWWRLLDSNQWPHACEDSIGASSAGFWENKAALPRDFHTRRYALFHCFRPIFSARGSGRGSKRDSRFLFASGKALSYGKAGFLTEYAELGKMRSGAARTAGGQHFPEGR